MLYSYCRELSKKNFARELHPREVLVSVSFPSLLFMHSEGRHCSYRLLTKHKIMYLALIHSRSAYGQAENVKSICELETAFIKHTWNFLLRRQTDLRGCGDPVGVRWSLVWSCMAPGGVVQATEDATVAE